MVSKALHSPLTVTVVKYSVIYLAVYTTAAVAKFSIVSYQTLHTIKIQALLIKYSKYYLLDYYYWLASSLNLVFILQVRNVTHVHPHLSGIAQVVIAVPASISSIHHLYRIAPLADHAWYVCQRSMHSMACQMTFHWLYRLNGFITDAQY